MSSDNPKPLARRHSATPWALFSKRIKGELFDAHLKDAHGRDLSDLNGEEMLVNLERSMRCVNACALLNSDDPMREIEALLRDRARLIDLMAKQGYKRPASPDVVLRPVGDDDTPAEHESIYPQAEDGRKQIGPLDV